MKGGELDDARKHEMNEAFTNYLTTIGEQEPTPTPQQVYMDINTRNTLNKEEQNYLATLIWIKTANDGVNHVCSELSIDQITEDGAKLVFDKILEFLRKFYISEDATQQEYIIIRIIDIIIDKLSRGIEGETLEWDGQLFTIPDNIFSAIDLIANGKLESGEVLSPAVKIYMLTGIKHKVSADLAAAAATAATAATATAAAAAATRVTNLARSEAGAIAIRNHAITHGNDYPSYTIIQELIDHNSGISRGDIKLDNGNKPLNFRVRYSTGASEQGIRYAINSVYPNQYDIDITPDYGGYKVRVTSQYRRLGQNKRSG